jgi:hypothetical protein
MKVRGSKGNFGRNPCRSEGGPAADYDEVETAVSSSVLPAVGSAEAGGPAKAEGRPERPGFHRGFRGWRGLEERSPRTASRSMNHEGTQMRTNDSTFRVFRVFRGRTLRRFRASLCRNPDFLTPGFVSPRCLCASVVKRSRFRTAPRVGNHGSTRWHTDKGGLGVAAAARRGP